MVAECYLDGIGVEKNIERAETWLYRAARLGNKRAQMLLRTR
jgi:TPR repeat protein